MCFYLNYDIAFLPIPNPLLSWCLVRFDQVLFFQVFLKLWPIIRFQQDQFLHECSIFVVLIGCILPPCNRSVAVFFSHVGSDNFPCFQEGDIPLVFHLKYFLFFFVSIAKSCVSRVIFSAVSPFNFFVQVVRVIFTAFGTSQSSSIGFPLGSIFLTFKALQESWDVLLDFLKTIADLHLLGSTGLVKCQDVSVGLDSFFAFSNGDSYICNSLFFQS